MKLNLTPYPSSLFAVCPTATGIHLVQEASTLGGNWLAPLYDDACDVGLAVRSVKTGTEIRFCLAKEERRDGEISAWHFEPASRRERADAKGVTEVVIFND